LWHTALVELEQGTPAEIAARSLAQDWNRILEAWVRFRLEIKIYPFRITADQNDPADTSRHR
jgi:hypothetical protein